MKKLNKWTPAETEMLQTMINRYEGSPSGAYADHPDWKTKLESKHTPGAIYAKIHNLKGSAKKKQPVGNKPPAAGSRFLVVREEDLQTITCPKCRHAFRVMLQ